MTGLLHEAYSLQFQISTLLAATEEPIPERQWISKQPVDAIDNLVAKSSQDGNPASSSS